jgi:hypothetical protein
MLRSVHARLPGGRQIPDWPDIIPAAYRPRLRTRTGLRRRFETYIEKVSALALREQDRTIRAFAEENDIARLRSGSCECEAIDDLPQTIRDAVRDLFDYSFGLLAGLGIRDECYRLIFAGSRYQVCAFCGVEYFDAPGAPRQALDHYLAQSRYPFAAANLRNLVPMGDKCNSKYKLSQDILRRSDGTRRRAFDPYGAFDGVTVSLRSSIPFEGRGGQLPAWDVDFGAVGEEVDTWNEVFRIRERYIRDILDPHFRTWLGEFSAWSRGMQLPMQTKTGVLNALKGYISFQDACGLNDRAFLKGAAFRMLLYHCKAGNERLIQLLGDLATI